MSPEPKSAPNLPAKYAENLFWPALPVKEWEATRATLHMWTQMAGKVRLALTPLVNHWWNVPLYVNSRGLTTSAIPYGKGAFEIQFDFLQHILEIKTCDAQVREIALKPRSVADFYREFMKALASLDIHVKIWPMPVEIPDPIRFEQDLSDSLTLSDSLRYANYGFAYLVPGPFLGNDFVEHSLDSLFEFSSISTARNQRIQTQLYDSFVLQNLGYISTIYTLR